MAEAILALIIENFLGNLGSRAVQGIELPFYARREIEKLKETLITIRAVLLDAEGQQETRNEIRVWLERLKDVCFSANDILDEFEIDALQRQVIQRDTIRKVRRLFSSSNSLAFHFRMGYKIKRVRKKLDEIAVDKNKFHLSQHVDRKITHNWRETHSSINASNVIGRDFDKEKIIDHLLQIDHDKCACVITITGIGGLGKTTLAKSVYNDARVIEHFEMRKWVYVSEVFDLRKIIGNIVGMKEFSMQQLVEHFQTTFSGKKYLLILDDIWNDDISKWRDLWNLLLYGANGSKIVVTTRNQSVSSIVNPTYTHKLEGLSSEDSLSLLMKWAFSDWQNLQYPYIIEIGREIVDKCKGVPLAIRTLGSLLYMKTEECDWCFVRDNEIWNLKQGETDILPALELSYNQLPYYLKPCFAICSIFEKGCMLTNVELIYLWMAFGLLDSTDQNMEWEDIGKKFVTELWSRSFFQDVGDSYFQMYKMHDLIHDLALSVTKTDSKRLSDGNPNVVYDKKIRHISFHNEDLVTRGFPNSVIQLKNLWTIRVDDDLEQSCNSSFVHTCFSKFKFLRVLYLRNSSVEVLPSSVGSLKHLRLLDLSWSERIKALPDSICKLQSLQSLGLGGCSRLEKLPRDFGNLISLRCLFLKTKEVCFSAKGMGSLSSLRTLFIAECTNLVYLFDDYGICMERNLTGLRTLTITACESLISLPRSLICLTRLECLLIERCNELNLMTMEDKSEVTNSGCGLVSLRVLHLIRLPKLVTLPHWLLHGATTSLKCLEIKECGSLLKLPEDLKSLQKLSVEDCSKVTCLSFGTNPLSASLGEVRILGCPKLKRRCQRNVGEEWHKISHVPNVYLDDIKI